MQEVVQTLALDDRYIHSPEYLALVRGALRLMHVEHVDLLVVGLPVALFRAQHETLARRLAGTHPLGSGISVTVRAVKVLAQPVGDLLRDLFDEAVVEHEILFLGQSCFVPA